MEVRVDSCGLFKRARRKKNKVKGEDAQLGRRRGIRKVSQGLHLGQRTWLEGTRKGDTKSVGVLRRLEPLGLT